MIKKITTVWISFCVFMAVLVLIAFCGCENKTETAMKEYRQIQNKIVHAQKDLDAIIERAKEVNMQEHVKKYNAEIRKLTNERLKLHSDISKLRKEIKLAQAEVDGTISYLVTLELKQSHFSLNPAKHIKDAMNAVEFTIPVSKDFYNELKEGEKMLEEFRGGSFWTEGSFGDWNVTVVKKEIKIEK